MSQKISRRQFLKAALALGGTAGLIKIVADSSTLSSQELGATRLPTAGHTETPTSTFTPTPTGTAAPTSTGSATPTPTVTASPLDAALNAQELETTHLPAVFKAETPTPTHTPTSTATATPTNTATATATRTTPPPSDARVVHVHNLQATNWAGQADYWNYTNPAAIDAMVDNGIMALTAAGSLADAWRTVLPNYQAGQPIAIKVNFNNANNCTDTDDQIDALAEPVNAVIRGLTQIGVAEKDIWIFEARRRIPARFAAAIQAADVRFFDNYACSGVVKGTFDSNDPNASVTFNLPADIPPLEDPIKISDVLIDAAYLINMPIMKTHGGMGITLAFKNHFGTIDEPSDLHNYAGLTAPYYRGNYSVLVDLYRNPHILNKTVLTIGDGLFAAQDNNTAPPRTWNSFGNKVPNSLFFSFDPVAIDCVMCDFLAAEVSLPAASDDYLRIAAQANLGTYERGDPWGSGYSQIQYQYLEL